MLLSARDHAAATNYTIGMNTPRIAFLFLVRDPIPHESLWRRFFRSYEDLYSVYVHAKPGFQFPSKSFFHCREIPSKPVSRFAFNMVDAVRRLLAHALLDSTAWNQWFVFVCESSVPVRSFRYVYDYLMASNVSFVDASKPAPSYYCWNTQPEFPRKKLRKGELWMAMLRRHAAMVVAERKLYRKFKRNCKRSVRMCTPDEEYMQTLIAIEDPTGISNKTVMYVNWSGGNVVLGSPLSHSKKLISPRLIRKIQNHSRLFPVLINCTSQLAPTNLSATHQSCKNLQSRRPSYLFARKFPKESAASLFKLPPSVLGF